MKYKLRYKTLDLLCTNNLDTESIRKQHFDTINTIFTCIKEQFYQYSIACRNSEKLVSMSLFGTSKDNGSRYEKIDDLSLFHDMDEINEIKDKLLNKQSLRDIKLIDYYRNTGDYIELPYEIGTKRNSGVCAGYLIRQNSEFDSRIAVSANPIFVLERKWDEFLAGIEDEGFFELFTDLLTER